MIVKSNFIIRHKIKTSLAMKNKSIIITGHTKGLGAALYTFFSESGYIVRGYSRSEGCDLTNQQSRDRLVEESKEFDIVINNARAGFAQVELLSELHSSWSKQSKSGIIINLGSISAVDYLMRPNYEELYYYQKQALNSLSSSLSIKNKDIKVVCVNPGYIATERILSRGRSRFDCLSVDYVVSLISWIINQPPNVVISTINLQARPELESY
jgi:short-subunit dehydrogenase